LKNREPPDGQLSASVGTDWSSDTTDLGSGRLSVKTRAIGRCEMWLITGKARAELASVRPGRFPSLQRSRYFDRDYGEFTQIPQNFVGEKATTSGDRKSLLIAHAYW